jgi:hypothetical protein
MMTTLMMIIITIVVMLSLIIIVMIMMMLLTNAYSYFIALCIMLYYIFSTRQVLQEGGEIVPSGSDPSRPHHKAATPATIPQPKK